ncbi:TNF receptor-associated factor 4-like isoform X2 [Oopsacas minuta]|uniref:TNF receptor-associated factor 4-like isoform X2 n=1 Tax=Oopsacas minuta TaxID=111878 RepID=A0AAV7KA12_9METZ|nr:TNF receptor-associated factor 4-like isoform X2 [Oopsacas minuta]
MAAKPPEVKTADDKNDTLFIKIDGTHRGYKKEFLSQNIPPMMESILVCPICKGIMNNATVCLGSITCETCATPKGDKSKVTQVVSTVLGLDVKCPLLRQCEWSGKLSATQEHLDKCLLFKLKCPQGCGVIIERSKEANHKTTECVKRKINCKHCKKPFNSEQLDEHLKNCDSQPIKCPDGCGKEVAKKDAATHKNNDCPLADVKCPYDKYGCKLGTIKRKELMAHKTGNVMEHQDYILGSLAKLETENANLKKELTDTKTQLALRITNLEKGVKK